MISFNRPKATRIPAIRSSARPRPTRVTQGQKKVFDFDPLSLVFYPVDDGVLLLSDVEAELWDVEIISPNSQSGE